MAASRQLPPELRAQSEERTAASVAAITAAIEAIEAEAASKGYDVDPVTLKDLMKRASLGEKFLYGSKHKTTSKPFFEARLHALNQKISNASRPKAPQLSELQRAREEMEFWKQKYQKLARFMNTSHARIRELQKEIRQTKASSPKVVPLRRDK